MEVQNKSKKQKVLWGWISNEEETQSLRHSSECIKGDCPSHWHYISKNGSNVKVTYVTYDENHYMNRKGIKPVGQIVKLLGKCDSSSDCEYSGEDI